MLYDRALLFDPSYLTALSDNQYIPVFITFMYILKHYPLIIFQILIFIFMNELQVYAEINRQYAKINRLYAEINRLYARINRLSK